jgi:hypothetical protein
VSIDRKIQICGMRGFPGGHRSDVLYQGTTLAGRRGPNIIWAFAPALF